jgi:riboflavin kinase / FMN adenylyltransferase
MKSLFVFWGKVKKGKDRGKLLGFPTANIALHKKIPEGVYTSQIVINKRKHLAATFIGSAKTFNENKYQAESYILDFSQNIYGKWITVRLFKKLRGNIKFKSQKELIKQIEKDVLTTRNQAFILSPETRL